ncbi:MAG: proline dehydrogenase [Chaenotheca gracillima]|nr:MAG: proline dehydrogenase [Chaenotheca gracillima]
MLLTARTYALAQAPDKGSGELKGGSAICGHATGWQRERAGQRRFRKMLLLHQTGSVKIGEVVRQVEYTVTYTPSADRILPTPEALHVRIKNTSAIPLRAAYLHGPYTLHVATYPSVFDPNRKLESPERDGIPEYEPNLKAGGTWSSTLQVPEDIRESVTDFGRSDGREPKAVTWVIEITSQIIFSHSAAVHYELLVGRDDKSLDVGFAAVVGGGRSEPGKVEDHQIGQGKKEKRHSAQPKGVHSKAVKLVVEDTASLWNKPALPQWEEKVKDRASSVSSKAAEVNTESEPGPSRKKKKIHLVFLTHGLHSNLGADMLYLKESIDAAAKEARDAARAKRAEANQREGNEEDSSGDHSSSQEADDGDLSDEDEQVIVRGFSGNAVRTEKGIKYLGKRLARYVLSMTYPDQPFLPITRSGTRSFSLGLTGQSSKDTDTTKPGKPVHARSTIHRESGGKPNDQAYKITSISFVGHSLGGLVQTYAIAYVQKHSPHFFEHIKPINFIALASPFLGLSNENPLYVKFALDFGLVGRTGQDLGLTWRAPNIARTSWGAMVGGLGNGPHKAHEPDPGAKPLLRILPTGPAHKALKMFRNRTVYSNVVNDGIVPLRTSCLLFLDWRGLGRVEKARRENGLVGTVAGWGWAELTGANSYARQIRASSKSSRAGTGDESGDEDGKSPAGRSDEAAVPQPDESDANDTGIPTTMEEPAPSQFLRDPRAGNEPGRNVSHADDQAPPQGPHPFSSFLTLFRPQHSKGQPYHPKSAKVYNRSQTLPIRSESASEADSVDPTSPETPQSSQSPSHEPVQDPNNVLAPPKTSIFESAGALLNPPLPSAEYLIDPSSRARTIFHDRVYHPEDIPPPPRKRHTGLNFSFNNKTDQAPTDPSKRENTMASISSDDPSKNPPESAPMKVEEKIARAYHHELSWRKVLVSLEPDAHNNMIVRRTFANAYGWPVVKHLVDTHFADTYEATTSDAREPGDERAKDLDRQVGDDGDEVRHGRRSSHEEAPQDASGNGRTPSEAGEGRDTLTTLSPITPHNGHPPSLARQDSAQWSDRYFDITDDSSQSSSRSASPSPSQNQAQTQTQSPPDGHHSAKNPVSSQFQAFLFPPNPPSSKTKVKGKDKDKSQARRPAGSDEEEADLVEALRWADTENSRADAEAAAAAGLAGVGTVGLPPRPSSVDQHPPDGPASETKGDQFVSGSGNGNGSGAGGAGRSGFARIIGGSGNRNVSGTATSPPTSP